MITFADDHEAALWRAVMTDMAPPLYTNTELEGFVGLAALYADDAVLEYRKRCGHKQPTAYEVAAKGLAAMPQGKVTR